MNKFVVFSDSADYERYWTGEMADTLPHMAKKIENAATFPTARAAYDAATAHPVMLFFRVGRRPTPVNLRVR